MWKFGKESVKNPRFHTAWEIHATNIYQIHTRTALHLFEKLQKQAGLEWIQKSKTAIPNFM